MSGFAGAPGANPKSTRPNINRNSRKTRCRQASRNGRRLHWNERAVPVNRALQPSILYFKREEKASRPQHPVDFRERAILQLTRTQMMQNQHRDCRRKTAAGEWQSRGVTLQNDRVRAMLTSREPRRKRMTVFETGDADCAPAQLIRGGPGTRAQLEHMIP
jgi:hypothetical protein